jgi:hypothetical protein
MQRRIASLLLLTALFATQSANGGETLAEFFHRPSSQGVVVTEQYKGHVKQRFTYPGYTARFQPPGWIRFGYPGENYPTSRNFGGPGYVGF